MPVPDRHPERYTAVICYENVMGEAGCDPQGLTDAEYMVQMMRSNSLWRCPVCGATATWDDERYEKAQPELGDV